MSIAVSGFVPKTIARADALRLHRGVLHTDAEITAIEALPGVAGIAGGAVGASGAGSVAAGAGSVAGGAVGAGGAAASPAGVGLSAFAVFAAPPATDLPADAGVPLARMRPSPVEYRGETGRTGRLDTSDPARPGIYMFRGHLGQEKLGIAALHALTMAAAAAGGFDKLTAVVYAGAAPGTNIAYVAGVISAVAPALRWHLYDPAAFAPAVLASPLCAVHTGDDGLFTDEIAVEWGKRVAAGELVVFFSDIRSGSHAESDFEKEVVANMDMQRRWVVAIRPLLASLKFRLPYVPAITAFDVVPVATNAATNAANADDAANATNADAIPTITLGGAIPTITLGGAAPLVEYLAGTAVAQAWAPTTSTESRLMVPAPPALAPYPVAMYDAKKYESACFHNNLAREYASFPEAVRGVAGAVPGMCSCLDCALGAVVATAAARAMRRAVNAAASTTADAAAEIAADRAAGGRILAGMFAATRHRLANPSTGHGIDTGPATNIAAVHATLAAKYSGECSRARDARAARRPLAHSAPTHAQGRPRPGPSRSEGRGGYGIPPGK